MLLGISDIEKLEQLFTTIIETENSSPSGRNYRRNTKINQYIYDMRRVSGLLNGNNSSWDKAFNDLWRFNTYVYGPILFLHKAHLHFARSDQSRKIYEVFFKDLIFKSPNFVANSERGKREQALKDRRADYGYKNWFWKFDEYITTLYLHNISHHFNHIAKDFDPKTGNDPAAEALEKMLVYFDSDMESIVEDIKQFREKIKDIVNNSETISNDTQQFEAFENILLENNGKQSIVAFDNKLKELEQKIKTEGGHVGNTASLLGNIKCSSAAAVMNIYSIVLTASATDFNISALSALETTKMSTQALQTSGQMATFYNKVGFKYFKVLQGTKAAASITKYCTFTAWIGVGVCGISAFNSVLAGEHKDAILSAVEGVGSAMVVVGGGIVFGTSLQTLGIGMFIGGCRS